MSTFIRASAFLAALIVLAFGFTGTGESADRTWLVCLGVSGALFTVSWWPSSTRSLPLYNRTLLRWATIVLVGFALVSVQLVRIQIVESARISSRVEETADGEFIANPRARLASLEARRGRIFDTNGVVLADTVLRDDGTYERRYPVLATAPLIGYFSPSLFGSSNIEREFDDYLSGARGGNPIAEWLDGILNAESAGYNLSLTIDARLQQRAVDLLDGRPGAVILMDASTGAVTAMAGAPVFDPNRLYANLGQQDAVELAAIHAYWQELIADPNAPLVFRPTQGLYNPGSTFKTVTASALLDQGIATTGTIFRDEGLLEVEGRIIEEPNRPDPSQVDFTLEQAYAWSLNVVFAQIGLQLRGDAIWDYASRFGFGDAVPFDIDTSESQIAGSRDALNSLTLLADTGYGQGQILSTPLQMALVLSAVVNGGEIMQPFVVHQVIDEEGDVLTTFGNNRWRRVMSADTASAMRELLIATVEYGYSTGAAIDGVVVGGKTGTAELDEGEPHSWFTGFAEDGDRRLVVTVIVERGGPGSQTALPIGRAMLEAAMQDERE
ncbi:MAG TPA: penicillin-binding transpeptidase domain-containing protein [Thermomicrobiales bacterium]|nr:penicillin-binding transpeptidase domain-containing protein [Thermomicrobiales bacterium]